MGSPTLPRRTQNLSGQSSEQRKSAVSDVDVRLDVSTHVAFDVR
jgi:hypothetical protein